MDLQSFNNDYYYQNNDGQVTPKGFIPFNEENRGRSKSLGRKKKGEKAPRFKSEHWNFAPSFKFDFEFHPTQFLEECKSIMLDGLEQVNNSFLYAST